MDCKGHVLTIFLIACVLFSISGVVATDVNETIIAGDENPQIVLETSNITEDDDFESDSEGTFQELAIEIEETPDGGILNLYKNYKYSGESDTGILIDKKITINGNNHIIDGNNQKRIFECYDNEIILNNINFCNAKSGIEGSAIYSETYLEITIVTL